jgi:hypothetical protein
MATIVEYTDRKAPRNSYPQHIISPSRSGLCCAEGMEELGQAEAEGRQMVQYKRCHQCGFTVRVVLRELEDTRLAAELRQTLATAFQRHRQKY